MFTRPFKLIAKETLTSGSAGNCPVKKLTFEMPGVTPSGYNTLLPGQQGASLAACGFDLSLGMFLFCVVSPQFLRPLKRNVGDFVQVKSASGKGRSYSPCSPVDRVGTKKKFQSRGCRGNQGWRVTGMRERTTRPASRRCFSVGSFDLVVKIYQGGRVSGYLDNLQIGEVIYEPTYDRNAHITKHTPTTITRNTTQTQAALIAGPGPVPWNTHKRDPGKKSLVAGRNV